MWEREGREGRRADSLRARGAGTHGDVLNLHTEVFSACQAAPQHHNTTQRDTDRERERNRERQRKKEETERDRERQRKRDKTRQ